MSKKKDMFDDMFDHMTEKKKDPLHKKKGALGDKLLDTENMPRGNPRRSYQQWGYDGDRNDNWIDDSLEIFS
jgi:hypothetical protein